MAVRPSAQLRVRRQLMIAARSAEGDGCWRRLMLGAAAAWNVEWLMLGGDVTRSWEMDRLSEECGLKCADILENRMK